MSKMKYFQSDFPIIEEEINDSIINDLLTKMYDNLETLNRVRECKN